MKKKRVNIRMPNFWRQIGPRNQYLWHLAPRNEVPQELVALGVVDVHDLEINVHRGNNGHGPPGQTKYRVRITPGGKLTEEFVTKDRRFIEYLSPPNLGQE